MFKYILTRSFITCAPHKILFGWASRGRSKGRANDTNEVRNQASSEYLNGRKDFGDLDVDGIIILNRTIKKSKL
jgi:hypothetical protein